MSVRVRTYLLAGPYLTLFSLLFIPCTHDIGVAANGHAKTPSPDVAVPLLDLAGRDANTGAAATHATVVMEMMTMTMTMMMTTTTTTTIPAPPSCPVIRLTSAATRIARILASK